MKRPRQPERSYMEQIITAAKLLGYAAYHTHDSRRSAAGWPDLALLRGHVLLLLEVKRDGEDPEPAQAAWLEGLCRVTRVRVGVARPSNWPEIQAVLKGER